MAEKGTRGRAGHDAPRLTILTLADFYLPGFRAGGPVRSLQNMASTLGDDFGLWILTRDRDLGSDTPYSGILRGDWQEVGGARVRYLRPAETGLYLRKVLRSQPYDVLYLNSFLSARFTLIPLLLRRLHLIRARPTVLAPRGEFSPGAISLKSRKKRLWIFVSRILGMYRRLVWQASSQEEAELIRTTIGRGTRVIVAPDIVATAREGDPLTAGGSKPKAPGAARIVFLSRIAPMKNLMYTLKIADRITAGRVMFDIFGPVEDRRYWMECERWIRSTTNPRVQHRYRGELPHGQVHPVLARYDLMLFPTLGENFGHIVPEALAAGCPVVVSDQTPWNEIGRAGAGWVIPLDSPQDWLAAIQEIVDADERRMTQLRTAASLFARTHAARLADIESTRELFILAFREGTKP